MCIEDRLSMGLDAAAPRSTQPGIGAGPRSLVGDGHSRGVGERTWGAVAGDPLGRVQVSTPRMLSSSAINVAVRNVRDVCLLSAGAHAPVARRC